MIVFLLIIIIAIMLFGAQAIGNAAGKILLGIILLIVVPIGFILLDKMTKNIPWFILLPSIIVLFLISFLFRKKSHKPHTKINVDFELVNHHPFTFVKITDKEGRYVILYPMEVYVLLHQWTDHNKPYMTVFQTLFKKLSALEVVNNNKSLAKELEKRGISFYVQIQQYSSHSHQTNHTIFLKPIEIYKLQAWMNKVKQTNDFIKKSYTPV